MGKILVIAEKPDAGKDYAKVLGCTNKYKGYIEGDKYIVTWAIGHLVSLKQPDDYDEMWKKWSMERLPIIPKDFETKVLENTRLQFNIIKTLINRTDVTSIINGGDAGREGELIQRYIYEKAKNKKPIKRLWVSSLTEDAIRDGFNNLKESNEFDTLYEAAKVRAEVDWLYGMNYTRGYTLKYGGGKVLSVGRCQTPILKLIVDRDKEIDKFVPVPYSEIDVNFEDYKAKYIDKNNDSKIMNLEEAKRILNDIDKQVGVVTDVKNEKKSFSAPLLFNLNSLSQLMNKKYGFSAQKTLDVLQKLYETYKIATYPRASAKVISLSVFNQVKENIGYISFGDFAEILPQLKIKEDKRYVNDSKIEDHHAIIPDFRNPNIKNVYPKLNSEEKCLFDELVKSILAIFLPNYEYITTTILTQVKGYNFISRGKVDSQLGWKILYKNDDEDESDEYSCKISRAIGKNDKEKVLKTELLSKKTKPKNRYTEGQILSEMAKYGIGTQATAPSIIETLKIRNYVEMKGKSMISTQFGKDFIEVINIDDIKSVELTARLEDKLKQIADGKLREDIVINSVLKDIERNILLLKKESGISINDDESESLGVCPICHKGVIKANKKGYGCSNYKDGCQFFIGKICGKEIPKTQVIKLITDLKTDTIKGFISKAGKGFDAKLKLNDKGMVEFDFSIDEKDIILCPKCKNTMINNDSICKCEKCDIVIFKNVSGKKLSNTVIKQLLNKDKTNKMKGFKSKTGKEFEAALKLNDKGRVEFDFS